LLEGRDPLRGVGQGEVDWDALFGTLRGIEFDGVATVCVFAWEERAVESSKFMLDRVMTRHPHLQPSNDSEHPAPTFRPGIDLNLTSGNCEAAPPKDTPRRPERSGA
jgi:hypothetical protein